MTAASGWSATLRVRYSIGKGTAGTAGSALSATLRVWYSLEQGTGGIAASGWSGYSRGCSSCYNRVQLYGCCIKDGVKNKRTEVQHLKIKHIQCIVSIAL